MTRDIISEVLMRMPNPAEKWKTYSADMKEILFNDFKASYYNLLSLYYIYLLSLILINLYWCRISTDLHQIMIVAWQERFGI